MDAAFLIWGGLGTAATALAIIFIGGNLPRRLPSSGGPEEPPLPVSGD